jgi:predicted permease
MRWFRRSDKDFTDEVRAHIALEADRLVAEGMPPDRAVLEARRRFGNVTSAAERYRESRRIVWLDQLGQDLRAGARRLRRYPVAALVAVFSLAAGIGATSTFLTIRDVVYENYPPLYAQPEQLSKVQVDRQNRLILPIGSYVPGDLYTSWAATTGLTMAASLPARGGREIRTAERMEVVAIRAVTANFFGVLGVNPVSGRVFTSSDVGGTPAILSHRHWEQWFGARADAIGATIWIDNVAHTVVGVMPDRFWFSEFNPPVWTLLDPGRLTSEQGVQVIVRRDADMGGAALDARLQDGLKDYSSQLPAGRGPLHMLVSSIKGTPLGDQMSPALPYVLGVSIALTLLIACANVAILMIAQWTMRETETAVRAALGASRSRLVRALIAESMVLALAGGTIGVGVMLALRGIFIRGSRLFIQVLELSLDPIVFLQVAAISIATGVIAGLGPALFETRSLQLDPLRGIRTSDRVRQRWSHALVVLEITVTLALLVVTSSYIDGLQRSRSGDMMFDATRLLAEGVDNPAGIPVAQLLEAVRQIPGVEAAAASTAVPLGRRGIRQLTSADSTGSNPVQAEWISSTEGFTSTLGVAVTAGRGFTSQDTPRSGTAMVSEGFARQLFAGASPIGRQFWSQGKSYDVIGVVSDYADNPTLYRMIPPRVYRPISLEPREVTSVRFLVRAHDDPALLVQPIRRALVAASPGNVVSSANTFRQILSVQGQEMMLGTAPFFPLIAIGMLLTAAGIYGVLAFAITRREREIAVRVAIGATRTNQMQLVALHSLRLLGIGVTSGVGITFALSRVVRAVGGGGSLYDPPWPAFVIPVLIVLLVGAIATWVPTRRALRINPALLLKAN